MGDLINVSVRNPLEKTGLNNLSDVFGFAANILLGVGWSATFIVLGLAVIKYINSQGDPKETHSAQQAMLYAIVGAVIMSAITLLRVIGEGLLGIRWHGISGITNFIQN
jgi:hypothetical protein